MLLCLFDKFKGTLTSLQANALGCECASPLGWQCSAVELTDGGDGFVQALTHAAGGKLVSVPCHDPLFRPIHAPVGVVFSGNKQSQAETKPRVVLEMATASGLLRLSVDERNPLRATTKGTGELILAALEFTPQEVLLGIGGSATNDLGLGALEALGLQAFDEAGNLVTPLVPQAFSRVARFNGNAVPPLGLLKIACDVTNPLLGPNGCTRVFGGQKGLKPQDFDDVERLLHRLAVLLLQTTGKSQSLLNAAGSGAAGGIGFGLTLFGATLVPGFETVARWINLDEKLHQAKVILTGEGCFDFSSLSGKGPAELLRRAASQNPNATLMLIAGKLEPGAVEALQHELKRPILARSLIPFNEEKLPTAEETERLFKHHSTELFRELQ